MKKEAKNLRHKYLHFRKCPFKLLHHAYGIKSSSDVDWEKFASVQDQFKV